MVLVEDEANWKEGCLVRKITDDAYIASHYYDESFTSIDWSQPIPQVLIPRRARHCINANRISGPKKLPSILHMQWAKSGIPWQYQFPLIDFLEQKADTNSSPTTAAAWRRTAVLQSSERSITLAPLRQ